MLGCCVNDGRRSCAAIAGEVEGAAIVIGRCLQFRCTSISPWVTSFPDVAVNGVW
jgi:hypothetical protein